MAQIKRYLLVLVSVMFVFGCGDSVSLKPDAGSDQTSKSESDTQAVGADVSKIDHSEYLKGPHKDFACSDCHDKDLNSDANTVTSTGNSDDSSTIADTGIDDEVDAGRVNDSDRGRDRTAGWNQDEDSDDRKGRSSEKRYVRHREHREHGEYRDHREGDEIENSDDSDHSDGRYGSDDSDHSGDMDSGDDENSFEDRGDSDQSVHGEDFEICIKCHKGFSGKHKKSNFSNRCNECHKSGNGNWVSGLRYSFDHSGVEGNCVSCHARRGNEDVNDHNGKECENCHTPDDWENTPPSAHQYTDNCKGCHGDDRPDTHFSGGPADKCETCHSYGKWKDALHEATTDCTGCHEEPSDMGKDCETCHTYDNWSDTSSAAHDYTGNCKGCHIDDRPQTHAVNSATELCENCHTYSGSWKKASHDAVTGCSNCHEAPAVAGHDNGTECESCHDGFNNWTGAAVRHTDSMVCEDCHTNKGSGHYGNTRACNSCHSVDSLPFVHKAIAFPLNHRGTDPNVCESCHVANDFASSGSCIYCHKKRNRRVHKTTRNVQCLNCHSDGRR